MHERKQRYAPVPRKALKGPRRASAVGGGSTDDVKLALTEAGVTLFGELGLTGTSTRMLAERAGVNIASISYYFGGKDGLYQAVVAHVADELAACTAPVRTAAQQCLCRDQISSAQAAQALRLMLESFADLILGTERPKIWARIIAREQLQPTFAFDVLFQRHMGPVLGLFGRLVGVCLEKNPDEDEVKVRAHAILSQVFGFFFTQEALLRNLGTTSLSPEQSALMKKVLWSQARASINCQLVEDPS